MQRGCQQLSRSVHSGSQRTRGWAGRLAAIVIIALAPLAAENVLANDSAESDTALIVAVDVSDSVDAERYRLQMEGIARALEDDGVINAILSGPKGGIAIALVSWADHAEVGLPWELIRSASDARRVAERIRQLPQRTGEYTCMSRMLEMVRADVVPAAPVNTTRIVLDVSGDGIDNCKEPFESARERDALVALGVTINGLPIIVKGENDVVGSGAYRAPGFELRGLLIGPGTHQTTLDAWYTDNVIGGPAGFLLKANGFEDFGRAFRQKFVSEISAAEPQ
jgi:Protein of unknown function (DUF1194)